MSTEIRWCPNCDEPKELNRDNFNKRQNSIDGFTLKCSKCLTKINKQVELDAEINEKIKINRLPSISQKLADKYQEAANLLATKHVMKISEIWMDSPERTASFKSQGKNLN